MKISFFMAVGLVLMIAQQSYGQDYRFDDKARDGLATYDLSLNTLITQSIVHDLQSIRSECLRASLPYRLDCVRQGIELTSRRTPFHGDYGPMRRVLHQAAASIAPIISANLDRSMARIELKPGSNPRFKSRRYLTAVASASIDSVRADAFKALDACRAAILKQGGTSPAFNKDYTTVGIALGSLADVLRQR
jgi:hypothetical protein